MKKRSVPPICSLAVITVTDAALKVSGQPVSSEWVNQTVL